MLRETKKFPHVFHTYSFIQLTKAPPLYKVKDDVALKRLSSRKRFLPMTKIPRICWHPLMYSYLNPTIIQIWKAIYFQNTLAQCIFLILKPKSDGGKKKKKKNAHTQRKPRNNVTRCQAYQQWMSRGTLLILSLSMRSVLTLSWALTIHVSCSDSSESSVLFWWWHGTQKKKNKTQKPRLHGFLFLK